MITLGQLGAKAHSLAVNLRGWKTRRKILVVESDDWGAIRMPSRLAWKKLLAAGIRVDRSPYDTLDCLENRADLQALMNVIDSHRDAAGRPAVMTFNTVMGNPDFAAIERDGFEHFHHQQFFDSYRQYLEEDLERDWCRATQEGLIRPQFHGREHLNVPLWMRDLKARRQETILAFKHSFYGLTTKTSSLRQANYLAAFWVESAADLESTLSRLSEGLSLFRDTFGYDSRTFVPCNYILPDQAQALLRAHGVRMLQSQRGQFVPNAQGSGGRIERAFTGKHSAAGLLRAVRNVMFEPFENNSADWVAGALKQIQQSFAFGKPAVVSSHRVNYVSGMSLKHRDRSLALLDTLLERIRRRWPDVEFLSSDQLLDAMVNS